MKIKCPICRIEYESVRGKDSHLLNHGSRILAMELNKLLFKIHEKIEYWEDVMTPFDGFSNADIVKELKSLLEDE